MKITGDFNNSFANIDQNRAKDIPDSPLKVTLRK